MENIHDHTSLELVYLMLLFMVTFLFQSIKCASFSSESCNISDGNWVRVPLVSEFHLGRHCLQEVTFGKKSGS